MVMRPLFSGEDIDLHIVLGTPILYSRSYDMIIFSDVHLGFEESVARGLDYSSRRVSTRYTGMFIPKIQLRNTLKKLGFVFKYLKPKRVIINGDLKHAFDRLLRQEREEVKKLLNYLISNGVKEIIVVRGNHDNFLPIILREYGIELVREYELYFNNYKTLFIHGHLEKDISKYDLVVIGHEHPSLRCFNTYKFPAFLIVPTILGNRIVVLPAMSAYHPGTSISLDPENYLSPLIKKYGILNKARVIVWVEYETVEDIEFGIESTVSEDLVIIDNYQLDNRGISVIEFKDIETALLTCGL
ncbi:metallophosphoesterase [Staphylothermus hellenicus]|uniref:Metallophosphoesterase n=1 Tax=Staphylothermus hellenicus (strain DSM 12710 / JCM 10830 / BK20S6-10-b1 / P8) TaxID=591019 RepID=D7D8X9_STAHD|nr:metallophosphoesterase [Staphylothermus hellenicus]ADI32225.1 metallophosphoesterase [Staphylothermus hellenicus DSM 12710]